MAVPPHDLEAEAALVGAMLLVPAVVEKVAPLVRPQDFYSPRHALIVETIYGLAGRGEPVDPVTVAAALPPGAAGIGLNGTAKTELVRLQCATPASANAAHYAEVVAERAYRRRLMAAASGLADAARDGDHVAEALAAVAREGESPNGAASFRQRFVPGGRFALDIPAGVPAVWGDGDNVAWAQGEPFLVVGPPGVGKTTIAGQLVLARIGLRDRVLGLRVQPDDRRILYLACDRPSQVARSFARMVSEEDRALLDELLVIWRGPLPADLAARPSILVEMAAQADAGTIVIDSLKDVAADLSKDETGSRVNNALQLAVSEGIEVIGLHHQRKGAAGAGQPKALSDVYGSAWLTAGAGSVVLLWGEPGDPVVELRHLKQPASEIGPWKVVHDQDAGTSAVLDQVDIYDLVRSHNGVTVKTAAQRLFDVTDPTRSQIEKARRRLDALVRDGKAVEQPGHKGGTAGAGEARYYLAALEGDRR